MARAQHAMSRATACLGSYAQANMPQDLIPPAPVNLHLNGHPDRGQDRRGGRAAQRGQGGAAGARVAGRRHQGPGENGSGVQVPGTPMQSHNRDRCESVSGSGRYDELAERSGDDQEWDAPASPAAESQRSKAKRQRQ